MGKNGALQRLFITVVTGKEQEKDPRPAQYRAIESSGDGRR